MQGNPDKTFDYEYIPEYAVTRAEVEVLQPKKASNMVVTPDFGQAQPGPDGFSVFKKEFNNLKPGANVQIKASYTKSDPTPSVVSQQQGQGEQSSGQPQQSKSVIAELLPKRCPNFIDCIKFYISLSI